jgi:hypothetical protein
MGSYFCAYHAEVVEIIMVRSCIFVNPTKYLNCLIVRSGFPADLDAWLNLKDSKEFCVHDIPRIRIALGPNNESFWACYKFSVRSISGV